MVAEAETETKLKVQEMNKKKQVKYQTGSLTRYIGGQGYGLKRHNVFFVNLNGNKIQTENRKTPTFNFRVT